jgi:hypothetical protein
MRRRREDQLSETGSRPAYLDEFARKLAAALARQTDAGKTRLGSARSSDVNVEVPSSPSVGEAITPRSMGEKQALDISPLQPLSETRETRTQFSSAEPTRVPPPQGDNAHDAAKAPAAGGTEDVHATQPAARLSDIAETPSDRAVKSPTEPSEGSAKYEAPPAVTHALPNGPTQEIGAATGPVDSKAPQTIDVEALLANVEASLANDAEVAQVVKPANLHARPTAEVTKRFCRHWKLMASAFAFVSVAMVDVVTLSHGKLAMPNTPPRADEPGVRETVTRDDDSAEQTLKDRAPEPSSAPEDRLGANSPGVGATASAAQANETPESRATQETIGLANGAPSGSTPEASDSTGPASPLASSAQPSGYKPAPADRTATATSSLGPPAQSLDPTPVSPQPAPTPTSGAFPTEGSLADHVPQPTAKPKRNAHDVGTAKLSGSRGDVGGKPSIGAKITKNDANSTPAATEKSNQPLPDGTPTNPEKKAFAPNVVHSPPADPGASAEQPLDHPTHAVGRGVVLAEHADPNGSDLRHAIGGLFGTGTAPGD